MTREEWAARLPLIQAFVDGKTVEYKFVEGWAELSNTTFCADPGEYRIKHEKEQTRQESAFNSLLKVGAIVEHRNHAGEMLYESRPEAVSGGNSEVDQVDFLRLAKDILEFEIVRRKAVSA